MSFSSSLQLYNLLPHFLQVLSYQQNGSLQLGQSHLFSCSANQYSIPFSRMLLKFLKTTEWWAHSSLRNSVILEQGNSSHKLQNSTFFFWAQCFISQSTQNTEMVLVLQPKHFISSGFIFHSLAVFSTSSLSLATKTGQAPQYKPQ